MVTAIGSDSVQQPCCKLALSFLLAVTAASAGEAAHIPSGSLSLGSHRCPKPFPRCAFPHGLARVTVRDHFRVGSTAFSALSPTQGICTMGNEAEGWPWRWGWARCDHRARQ